VRTSTKQEVHAIEQHSSTFNMSAPAQAANGAGDAKDPSGFLSEIIGAPVTVILNSGVVYKGMHIDIRSNDVF
jgi:hypothetical protein